MAIESIVKKDRFFVLKTNNLIEEFYTIEDALNNSDKQLVIIDKFKDFYSPSGGYEWRISEFIFIDENNQHFKLSNNSWTVHDIETSYKSSNNIEFIITLSDPSRKIKRLNLKLNEKRNYGDPNSHDISLVQTTLHKLREYSKYQSWEQMELETENQTLKTKIELLEKQIAEMK